METGTEIDTESTTEIQTETGTETEIDIQNDEYTINQSDASLCHVSMLQILGITWHLELWTEAESDVRETTCDCHTQNQNIRIWQKRK